MQSVIEPDIGFNDMCRICAKVGKNLVSLFHTKRKEKTMADMMICLQMNVQQNDGKPQNICMGCVPKLLNTFEFLNTMKNSDQYFQEMILLANGVPNKSSIQSGEALVTTVFDGNVEDPLASVVVKSEHMDVTEIKVKIEEPIHNETIVFDENKVIPVYGVTEEQPLINIPPIAVQLKTKRSKKSTTPSGNKVKYFECFICRRETTTFNRLKTHMKIHDDTVKPFKCYVCSEKFRMKYELNRHLCRGESINCEYCGDVFNSTLGIIEHLEIHKDTYLYYKCLKCPKKFHMKELNTWHDTEHERFQFACEICGKRFATKRLILNHQKRHLQERPHLCAQCGKGFKDKQTLKRHLIVHSGEKPFVCPECPSKFPRRGALTIHMAVHRVEKHVCHLCGNIYKSSVSLNAHQMRHGERDKACEICPLKFHTVHRLMIHMRKHTGEKPFKCTFCEVAYAQKNDLVKHLRTHIGENTYICSNCDMSYRYHADWRKHTLICNLAEKPPVDETTSIPSTSTSDKNV